MSMPETQKRDQRHRQTAEERKRRRLCLHEWEPIWCFVGKKWDRAKRGGWRRYCGKCDSFLR